MYMYISFLISRIFSDAMEQEISIQPGNDGGLWLYPTVIPLKAFIFSKIIYLRSIVSFFFLKKIDYAFYTRTYMVLTRKIDFARY